MRGPRDRAVIRILQFLFDDGGDRTFPYISRVLKLSPTKVHEKLVDLQSLGLVDRVYSKDSTRYFCTDAAHLVLNQHSQEHRISYQI